MNYDIYAIGNALVDFEYSVSELDLEALNVEKGVMSLIDAKQASDYKKQLQAQLKDQSCGGSAANTLIGASQFGASCIYSCRVADDAEGHFYLKSLTDQNVASTSSVKQSLEPTGQCFVKITPDAERTMSTYLGISAQFDATDINLDTVSKSDLIYIEGYLLTSPDAKKAAIELIKEAKKQKKQVALTCSDPNIVKFFKEAFLELIELGIDILFCNEQEALELSGKHCLESSRDYFQSIAKIVAITRGKDGADILYDDAWIHVESPQVTAIDTNGAGDCFAGVFLAGLSKNKPIKLIGKEACIAAAQLVQQYGPRLNTSSLEKVISTVFHLLLSKG